MERWNAVRFVAKLVESTDFEKLLKEMKLTAVQAMRLLKTSPGRKELMARRKLAKLQARLVAGRYSSYAVTRLCELLQDEKPEMRLKGALSLLSVSGLGKCEVRKKVKGTEPEAESPTPEDLELVEGLAEFVGRKPKGDQKQG